MKKKILMITRTALFIALLIALQAATASLGQFVTGSVVNLILILSVMLGGLGSGIVVAALSPFLAKLVGIGPAFWQLIPFVALGNIVLVLVWYLVANKTFKNQHIANIAALISGAIFKFATLYVGIVVVAVPLILKLEAPKSAVVSAAFSYPQLITASIGGAIACLVLPLLKKALKNLL